jgi:hypothetical protein
MLSLLPPGLQIVCPPAAAPLLASLQSSTLSLNPNSSRFSAPVSQFESIPGHADWILYTASTDLDALQQLLTNPRAASPPLVSQALAGNRILICVPSSPMPAALQQEFPAEMLPFLHRLQPSDIVLLPRSAAAEVSSDISVADIVLQYRPLIEIHLRGPACSRVPGPVASSPSQSLSAFRRALRRMFTEVLQPIAAFECLEAGLLLLHDFDDESHAISQSLEDTDPLGTASYWHGIMHRREPDASNAAWWFRKVGRHPAALRLAQNLEHWLQDIGASCEVQLQARKLLSSEQRIEPGRMIALSEQAHRYPGSVADSTLRLVQYLEILNLLTFSL